MGNTNVNDLLHPLVERRRAWRGVCVALLFSVLLHWAVVEGTPSSLFDYTPATQANSWEEMRLEYQPVPEPKSPELPEFVETNPAVPQNPPDETNQQAARDQQAAEEKPDKMSESEKPSVEGSEEDSPKIVDGSLEETASPLKPGLYGSANAQQPSPAQAQAQLAASSSVAPPPPPPDFIVQKPVSEEGPGSTLKETGEGEETHPDPQKRVIQLNRTGQIVEVSEEKPSEMLAREAAAQGVPAPRPRPKLKFKVPPGPTMKQPVRASRLGVVAIDANFSEFGDYTQRMIEAVSEQWQLLASRSNLADGNIGTRVVLEFIVDDEGNVLDMRVAYSDATQPARLLCQDAVISRAPYGAWTREMKSAIGEEMPIRFTFHYR